MNWCVFLYFFFFLILFWKEIKSKERRLVYQTVLLIFLLSSAASVWLVYESEDFTNSEISIEAVVYHIPLLWLLITPIKSFEKKGGVVLTKSSNGFIIPFTGFVIFMMLIYIFTGIQDVSINALATEAQELRDNLEVDYYNGNVFLSYLAYYDKIYSVVPLVLMFYYIKFMPKNYIVILLLLFCSMATAILSLREAAREYIVKLMFVSLSLYLLLRDNNISMKWKKKLKKIFIVLGVIAMLLFITITYMRFTFTREIGATESSVGYLGQGFVNFSEKYDNYPDGVYREKGKRVFPIIFGTSSSNATNQPKHKNIRLDIFSTGIGTWLGDCGRFITVIMVLLFSYLFRIIGRIKEINVFTLIYYALVYEMTFSLLFFYHGAWNIGKVSSIILLILLDVFSRRVKYGKAVNYNSSL